MHFKHFISSALLTLLAGTSYSETLSIEITNLTQGIYFTPLLVTAHSDSVHLFQAGNPATAELQAMAEGGDISGLLTAADAAGAVSVANPAEGLLAPGTTTSITELATGSNKLLSIVAMLLPTNDGFVGLDSWPIPAVPGSYTITLNAYDAGTEANNELLVEGSGMPGVLGIPANPGANGGSDGSGVTTDENNINVHIHRGNLGDALATGGSSDLNSSIHRWLNPVAKVTVTVQ